MADPVREPGAVSPHEVVERALDKAQAPAWRECPQWLKRDISPLCRFISGETLQKDLLDPGAEQEFQTDLAENEVADAYIDSLVLAAKQLIARVEAAETADDNPNAYHNAEHDRQVVERVAMLIKISKPSEQHPRVSQEEAEVLIFAAVYHDVDHPGGPALLRPEDGKSYEQHAVEIADEFARNEADVLAAIGIEKKFSLRQRAMLASAMIGTTFGDMYVQPQTYIERVMKVADLGGYMNDAAEWIDQSIEVADEYCNLDVLDRGGEEELPKTFLLSWLLKPNLDAAVTEWIKGQRGFITYELNAPHNEFQREHIDMADPAVSSAWSDIQKSLDDKSNLVSGMQTDPGNPKYADIIKIVRDNLLRVIRRDRQRVIERLVAMQAAGTLPEAYNNYLPDRNEDAAQPFTE